MNNLGLCQQLIPGLRATGSASADGRFAVRRSTGTANGTLILGYDQAQATESINSVAARWAEIVWAVSWQFCVLGLVVLVVHWSLRRAAPNWRYWLWQILAIKLLFMPFWTATAPWKWPGSSSTPELMTASPHQASVPIAKSASPLKTPESGSRPSDLAASEIVPKRDASKSPQPAAGQGTQWKTARSVASQTERIDSPSHPPQPVKSEPRRGVSGRSRATDPQANKLPLDRPLTAATQSHDPSQKLAPRQAASEMMPTVSGLPLEPLIPGPVRTPGLSWPSWLMLTWATGVMWFGVRIVWQGTALNRRLRQTEPADSTLAQRVREAAARLGMTRIPEIRVIELDVSPFVCGLWRTRLIVPRGLTESFTAEQLDLVLLHELAHVRRRDLAWGWIPEVGKVLFFFHPLVHFLCYQIRFERELACDQLAMQSSGRDVATYADTLVRVVGQFSTPDTFRMAVVESPPL